MPFIAKNKKTGERIDVTRYEHLRQALMGIPFICQLCEADMFLKAGMIKTPHFAHKSACDTDYKTAPESPEHREAKKGLAEYLRNNYALFNPQIELELPIPEIKRVIDVAAIFPSGQIEAHEVQLSKISLESLNERTSDYTSRGIQVVWWFGKEADTTSNRVWAEQHFGSYNCLQFGYSLEWDLPPQAIMAEIS